jgi:hypothetical protein
VLDFQFVGSNSGYYGMVERGAVMLPLLGGPAVENMDVVGRHAGEILKIYRAFLDRSRDAGYLSLYAHRNWSNCRPAFCAVKPHCHPCEHLPVCPHCWARQAARYWQRVDAGFFPVGPDGTRPERSPFELVRTTRIFGCAALAPYRSATGTDLEGIIADRCSQNAPPAGRCVPSRRLELRRLQRRGKIFGSLDVLVVGLAEGTWRVEIREVLAAEPGSPVELAGAEVVRVASPTRKDVVDQMIDLWRYPAELIVRPDGTPTAPRWAHKLLAARKRRHLVERTGIFSKEGVDRVRAGRENP